MKKGKLKKVKARALKPGIYRKHYNVAQDRMNIYEPIAGDRLTFRLQDGSEWEVIIEESTLEIRNPRNALKIIPVSSNVIGLRTV